MRFFYSTLSLFARDNRGPVHSQYSELDSAALGRPAAIVRYRGDVLDCHNFETGGRERPDGGLTARSGPLDTDLDFAQSKFHRLTSGGGGGLLGGEGRALLRSLESLPSGRRPRENLAVDVGDGDDRVVEGGLNE